MAELTAFPFPLLDEAVAVAVGEDGLVDVVPLENIKFMPNIDEDEGTVAIRLATGEAGGVNVSIEKERKYDEMDDIVEFSAPIPLLLFLLSGFDRSNSGFGSKIAQ